MVEKKLHHLEGPTAYCISVTHYFNRNLFRQGINSCTHLA